MNAIVVLTALGFFPPPAMPLPVSAHNCYLAGRGDNPRLAEALSLGIDNIEIDLGWDAGRQRLLVGHDATPKAGVAYPELTSMLVPALESHWKDHPGQGPTVLTVDWKTAEPEAVRAFKEFLDAHPDWFSSAPKPDEGEPHRATPMTVRRLTVCFTGSDTAKDAYDHLVPPGGTYRAFRDTVFGAGDRYRTDASAYVPGPATAYHRFLTLHWSAVERGGPFAAADWTPPEFERLAAILSLAHREGYRVRLYCLNGHTGPAVAGYRFRNDDAAKVRWLAASKAGADWVASDEYAEIVGALKQAGGPAATLHRSADLDPGETVRLTLHDGSGASLKLVGVDVTADPVRGAVRSAGVRLVVNGESVTVGTGNYLLPVTAGGVQVDCPVVSAYNANTTEDHWGLVKAARVRVWPKGSPWVEPDTFGFPARQKWLASLTQMANEPVYVDGGEVPKNKKVYYHSGLDIGGAEGLVEVVAAADGSVVSSGLDKTPGLGDAPVDTRSDVVYLSDGRGWYYRYSHLKTIDPAMKPGAPVKKGQAVGVLGKEGGSGGWSHLHFEIKARQPSGKWGTEEGYAFLWQSALREQGPEVVAVARPHAFARVGDTVRLDASRSWTRSGRPARHDWTFSDGTTSDKPVVGRLYETPGTYSETLKVTDAHGHAAYDFAAVHVVDPARPDRLPPTIHAAYAPTLGLKAGDRVTFKVRTFRVGTDGGHETWDFGDGTPPVESTSDGNARELAPDGYAETSHAFARAGDYLVSVTRSNRDALKATARLHVRVN